MQHQEIYTYSIADVTVKVADNNPEIKFGRINPFVVFKTTNEHPDILIDLSVGDANFHDSLSKKSVIYDGVIKMSDMKQTLYSSADNKHVRTLTDLTKGQILHKIEQLNDKQFSLTINPQCKESKFESLYSALSGILNISLYRYDAFSIHASCITYKGKGYLFLGKSGRGKSTHSKMWMEQYEGVELLNDDVPIVRHIDNDVWVYGTPWSGKVACFKQERVKLGGIVQLQRGDSNFIKKVSPVRALSIILPCIVGDGKLDSDRHNAIFKIIEKTIDSIPVYELWCTPTHEAAIVCKEAIVDGRI